MNYAGIRDASLQLINQYTVAGQTYVLSYNNQADYVNKIPFLVNSCLIEVSSSIRKLPATAVLYATEGDLIGKFRSYVLPEDCFEILPGGLFRLDGERGEPSYMNSYRLLPDRILIPNVIREDLMLEYFRRPQLLSERPADTDPIDADDDVAAAIPYYVASQLCLEDDAYKSSVLLNEWNRKLNNLSTRAYTTVEPVIDVYGLDMWDGGIY